MDEDERFEIKVEAFRLMTGHVAPGKDPPTGSHAAPYEERQKAWDEWRKRNAYCIICMIRAFEKYIERIK